MSYPELRSIVGANVPDLQGRVLQEQDTAHAVGQQIEAGLPNITGRVDGHEMFHNGWCWSDPGALFCAKSTSSYSASGTGGPAMAIGIDASKSNTIYGSSDTVQPLAYAVRYLIRALP